MKKEETYAELAARLIKNYEFSVVEMKRIRTFSGTYVFLAYRNKEGMLDSVYGNTNLEALITLENKLKMQKQYQLNTIKPTNADGLDQKIRLLIKQGFNDCHIFINDMEIKNLISVKLDAQTGHYTKITLEIGCINLETVEEKLTN